MNPPTIFQQLAMLNRQPRRKGLRQRNPTKQQGRKLMPEPDKPFPPDTPSLPENYSAVLAALQNREYIGSRNWQEQQDRANFAGAHPDIIAFEIAFNRALRKLGIPVFTNECIRSAERQDTLYALGHSKARAGQSAHNFGMAIDLVHSTKGWNVGPRAWDIFGHVGKEVAQARGLKLTWGGDWKFYDPAHWELTNWKAQREGFPYAT